MVIIEFLWNTLNIMDQLCASRDAHSIFNENKILPE